MSAPEAARVLDEAVRSAVAAGMRRDDAEHIVRMRQAGIDPGIGLARATTAPISDVHAEAPRPLIRELPPADPFPTDGLGDVLGAAAKAINDRVQSPLAICAQSTLAAATLAAQGHADVELPTGHVKPITSFFVSVAATGERKTATDHEALWPIKKREEALRESYDKALPDYQNAKLAWEETQKHVIKQGKGNRAAIRLALDQLGPPPQAPLTPVLTCQEPTYEGLVKHLVSGQPSVGIFSAEGGQFIGGHGMTDEAMLRTAAGLSCLWDGETIKRIRASDGVTVLPGRRVAMHLMAQPTVAALMLSDPLLLNQGLLSRCLVTAPDSNAGSRLWHDPAADTDAAIKRYGARILSMLERPPLLVKGKTNELAPRVLPLAAGAGQIWIGFADSIENQLKPDGALAPIFGLANKLPEHAARLAAVLALVADAEAIAISGEHMAAGIALAQHYAAEALRMFEGSKIDADLLLAQKLLGWLKQAWNESAVSLPDIYQNGPNSIRDKATATKLVNILEDHGWLHRIKDGATVAGHHRRDVWSIFGRS